MNQMNGSLMRRALLLPNIRRRMVTLNKFIVTRENIFSEINRLRCKSKLDEVRPVRDLSWAKGKKLSQAAVLVPLCRVNGVPSILFTLRSAKLSSHRGEVSFPGGYEEECDDHVIETAIRETEEEIGMDKDKIQVWGPMSPVPTSNMKAAVIPVVAYCGNVHLNSLDINTSEVTEVFVRSVESLCDPVNTRYTHFQTDGKTPGYTLPVFTGGPHRIWGLSAVILHQCLSIIAPGLYNFKFRQVPSSPR